MANQRKQIIINEITFWKQNKLLPSHYCDFLMTLYTEGEYQGDEPAGNAKQSIKGREKRKGRWVFLLFPAIAVILLVLLFTLDSMWLAGVPALLLAIASVALAFYYAKKSELLAPVLYISGALLLFGLSVKLSVAYFPDNNTALYGVLIGNSLFWLLSGWKMKLIYFTVSGVLGLLAILVYMGVNL
ncbi:MAG: hypothetical protein ACI33P_10810 [Lysinibacillus sp.]